MQFINNKKGHWSILRYFSLTLTQYTYWFAVHHDHHEGIVFASIHVFNQKRQKYCCIIAQTFRFLMCYHHNSFKWLWNDLQKCFFLRVYIRDFGQNKYENSFNTPKNDENYLKLSKNMQKHGHESISNFVSNL